MTEKSAPQTKWSEAEIEQAKALIATMTAKAAAVEMTKITGRPITKSSLIGILYRTGNNGNSYCKARSKGNRTPRPRNGNTIKLKLPKPIGKPPESYWRTVAYEVPRMDSVAAPLYKPKGTCQYIDDSNLKCEKECRGSWCEDHEKIVLSPRIRKKVNYTHWPIRQKTIDDY